MCWIRIGGMRAQCRAGVINRTVSELESQSHQLHVQVSLDETRVSQLSKQQGTNKVFIILILICSPFFVLCLVNRKCNLA